MDKKKYSNITENRKIYIAAVILALLILSSVIALILIHIKGSNRNIATIYVDGTEYMQYDLSQTEDMIFTITASNGSHNTVEIKDHNIHMLSAECSNNLCVKQGWAIDTALPIVCLPNNVVIVISRNDITKENNDYDAITY